MKTAQSRALADRREFLRGGVRYALLAGLTAMSAVLVKRRGTSLPNQTCVNQGICRRCEAFAECGLPQALSAKSAAVNSPEQQVDGSLPSSRYGRVKESA